MVELFTEDDIIMVGDHLKRLKGMILQDDNDEFFVLKDYSIEGISEYPFNWFKKRKEVRMFYIDSMTLETAEGEYVHSDDNMCSIDGLNMLMESQVRYSKLEKNLIKFTLKTGITLNFGKLETLN